MTTSRLILLPTDLQHEIVSFLGIRTLTSCAATCQELRGLTNGKLRKERELYEKLQGDARIAGNEHEYLRLDLMLCYVCDRIPSEYMEEYHVATRSDPVLHIQGPKFYDDLLGLLTAKHIYQIEDAYGFNEFHFDFRKLQQMVVFGGDESQENLCVRILTSYWESAGLNMLISVVGVQAHNPRSRRIWENPGWCVVTPDGLLYQVEGLEVPERQLASVQHKSVADLLWLEGYCLICHRSGKDRNHLCCGNCEPILRKGQFAAMLRSRANKKSRKRSRPD